MVRLIRKFAEAMDTAMRIFFPCSQIINPVRSHFQQFAITIGIGLIIRFSIPAVITGLASAVIIAVIPGC